MMISRGFPLDLYILALSFISFSISQEGLYSRVIYVARGNGHELQCSVPGFESPSQLIVWYKNGLQLDFQAQHSLVSDVLVISGFGEDDVGEYFCIANYSDGRIRAPSTHLKLQAKVDNHFTQTMYPVTQGDFIRLVCPMQSWVPVPETFQWYLNSQVIQKPGSADQRLMALPNGVLYIKGVQVSDAGQWACSALASSDSEPAFTSNNITLSVLNTSGVASYRVISRPPQSLQVLAGKTFVLECFLQPAFGEYVVWQYKDLAYSDSWLNVASDNRTVIEANQFLLRQSVHGDESVMYRCLIRSKSGVDLSEFVTTVTVYGHPKLLYPMTSFEKVKVDATRKVTLECRAEAFPAPSLIWLRNGEPVQLCHNKKVSDKGALQIEQTSLADQGYYQCLYSNSHGSLVYTYMVNVNVSAHAPDKPLIRTAKILPNSYLQVDWVACRKPNYSILAYTFVYVQNQCEPDVMSITVVVRKDNTACEQCLRENCDCCSHLLELPSREKSSYKVQLIAYSKAGGALSDPFTAVENSDDQGNAFVDSELGLEVLDFGAAVLFLWKPVQNVRSYYLRIQHQFHEGDQLIESKDIERSPAQEYALIKGFQQNQSFTVELEAVCEGVSVKQRKAFTTVIRDPSQVGPHIKLAPSEYSSELMVFWTLLPNPDYFYIWYKCDLEEDLVKLNGSKQVLSIASVETQCEVVVAPLLDNKPMIANTARYDRWCIHLPTPHAVRILPSSSSDDGHSGMFFSVDVEWEPKEQDSNCEVMYKVQWKQSTEPYFADSNYIMRKPYEVASLKNLMKDITYNIQVVAFSLISESTKFSAMINYTAGPPLQARDLQIDLTHSPEVTGISWKPPAGEHYVLSYIVLIADNVKGEWTTPVSHSVGADESLVFTFEKLKPDTLYNVTIIPLNDHGTALPISQAFWTPDTHGSAPMKLSTTQLGMIIGFTAAILILFLSALLYIIFSKRSKTRACKNTSTFPIRQLDFEDQAFPLQIGTDRVAVEPLGDVTENTPLQVITDNFLLTVGSLDTPHQLSHLAASAKDSGIADDQRISQDLDEYENDECLVSSFLSLDEDLCASPLRCIDGEQHFDSILHKRTHKDSETDSLLNDQKRFSLQEHRLKRRSPEPNHKTSLPGH